VGTDAVGHAERPHALGGASDLADPLALGIMALGFSIDAATQCRMLDYAQLIVEWNRVHRIATINDNCPVASRNLVAGCIMRISTNCYYAECARTSPFEHRVCRGVRKLHPRASGIQQPRLIAIVDDDLSVRTGLRRLLAAHAFAVEAYESATPFLVVLPTRPPNCVLLDLHMPGMNGFDVLEALQKLFVPIPAIVATAACCPPMVSRAMAAGAVQCLSKPVDETINIDAIRDALGC
jgi:CheY-like chemotaxis protein